jgi:multidrug efflux system membrane fusion protein
MMPHQTPSQEATEQVPLPQRGTPAKWIVLLLVALVALGAGAWLLVRQHAGVGNGLAAGGAAPSGTADRIVPVSVATAARRNVPIVLEGLGTVTPIAMVTVKTQVDGRLDKVLFKEGDAVKKGTVLAQVDARPFAIQLKQAEAALARDQAQATNAKITLERNQALLAENLVTRQQVDDSSAQSAQFEAQTLADRAQIDSARLQLEYSRIVSPIDGVTGVRQIDPGNIVRQSDQGGIVVVTQLDPIAVLFTLPQDDLAQVASELAKGPLKVDLTSRDGDQPLGTGELVMIDNQVNAQTSTIRLKAVVPNEKRILWPNAFVKAKLNVAVRQNALVVPTPAIQRGPQGTFVYVVVQPDNTVQMRPVGVERSDNETTIVAKGLAPGDVVVTDGQNQLRPGAKVAPTKPKEPAAAGSAESGEKTADSAESNGRRRARHDGGAPP